MKIVRFDSGFVFDDPNTYWGDPAYQLEPGDPGYVPPISVPNQPHAKKTKMKRQRYFPTKIAQQIIWLENFRSKLATYTTALGLSAPQVTDAIADARWMVYLLLNWQPAARAWALATTDTVTLAESGDGTTAMTLPVFTPPTPPAGVVPVKPGALNRIFALVNTINQSGGYTEAIGSDLGTIGAQDSGPDFTTLQPSFTVILQSGLPFLGWTWEGNSAFLDMAELEVNRGNGFVPLAMDTTPGYLDSFPTPLVPTKWIYRMRFRVGDHPVGLWSAEQSIVVGA